MDPAPNGFVFEPFRITQVKYRGSEIPRPRSGHRIVCDDANIYCFGGYNPNCAATDSCWSRNPTWTRARPLFRELWSFSMVTRKWKQHRVVENMPDELASNAMCMSGRYLMIFGGTGAPFGDKCSKDVIVWRTSPGDAKLEILDVTGSQPPGQYGHATLLHNGYFYTVGGTNGFSYNCDVYRLDLRTKSWEAMFVAKGDEEEPFGRYRHEVARLDDKLYVIGGGTSDWAFELRRLPVFDIPTSTWTEVMPKADDSVSHSAIPLPRKCHSAVQVESPTGTQVFVAGGSDGQSVFDDVWRLDMMALQWRLMQKTVLPVPLYFHSSTVTSYGCMYVFGGIEPKSNAACRNNVLYKVWLCIPKLSEMCWEALLHYHPRLDQVDRTTLLNIGIPMDLVNRLHPQ